MHETRLDRIAIIVADQMQHTVRDEQVELDRERYLESVRLTPRGLPRDDDLADEGTRQVRRREWERQDVRAPADTAVSVVEPSDRRIVDDDHVDVACRAAKRGEGPLGGPREPRRRHGDPTLAIHDCCSHQDGAGVDSRSPLRASWAS